MSNPLSEAAPRKRTPLLLAAALLAAVGFAGVGYLIFAAQPSPRQPPMTPAARFERQDVRLPGASAPPGVANVNLVHLFSKEKHDILVCDALGSRVLVYKPYASPPAWQVLAEGLCCAHAEVVDLDGDGIND